MSSGYNTEEELETYLNVCKILADLIGLKRATRVMSKLIAIAKTKIC